MVQISDDMMKMFMQMTGLSRKEAEKALDKSVHEMLSRPGSNSLSRQQKGKGRAKYTEGKYPHFLPSDEVKKYTIRVSLKGLTPAVWRKFECPSNISLRHFTELILELMGWMNEHLNQIQIGRDTYYVPYYQSDPDMEYGDTYYQEEFMLSDILSEKGKTVRWEYDFGDSWVHDIRLSSVDEYDEDESHDIVFKSGKGCCPPEDCGGVWGYKDLLELHEKRKSRKKLSSEEKERLEWYGIFNDYDPEDFDDDECINICKYFSESEDDGTIAPVANSHLMDQQSGIFALDDEKTSPLYDEILSLAFRIRKLEPWEDLDDSDVYAIKMQDGSEVQVATMGNGGESYDIQIFDGQGSFDTYLFITKNVDSASNSEIMDNHNWSDYKSISFQEPEDEMMSVKQYVHIERWAGKHGVDIEPEHGYPFLQVFHPHHYPFIETKDEVCLARVKEALEAIEWFSQEILDSEDLTEFGFKKYRDYPTYKGGKVVPLVVKTEDGYKVERTKLPGFVGSCKVVTLSETELQPLRFLPKSGTLLCRLMHIPGYLGEEDDRDNAYSAPLVMCVEKKTDMCSVTEPCELSESFEYDALRQYIAKVIKEKQIPQRIITDDARTEACFKDFCKQLGIILEFSRKRLPQLAYACASLYEEF